MKELIKQFYTEGFATTFYQKPIKWIKKRTKNKIIIKIFKLLLTIVYTILVLLFASIIFKEKWPF